MMKKIIKGILILFLICVIFVVGVNLFVCLSVTNDLYTKETVPDNSYDAIIVLGCGVRNGEPTRMLKDRLDTAIYLYNEGKCNTILMSGDHGTDGYDEVNTMFEYALEKGVPKEDIFLDHAGFSTYETMYRASEVFGIKKAIIITQEYHLYRSTYNAKRMGIEVVGVKVESDEFIEQPYYSVREYMARVKDFVFDIFKPEPTYLGETVDIHGDSSVTFDK